MSRLERVHIALMRASLWDFMQAAWPVIEPATPLASNWHLKLLCDEVQAAMTAPEGKQLLINVPPGTSKSTITSVMAPAWMWLRQPAWRAVFASANPRVTLRDSMKRRELIDSEWYRDTFRPKWKMAPDQDAKALYKNTETGFHQAITVGAKITGDRPWALFIDDPLDATDAPSKAARDSVILWYDQAFAGRVADPARPVRILIMQRLHEEDLSGHLLEAGDWHHVCLPMEYEKARAYPLDPRTQEGELLQPLRFPEHVLKAERKRLGSAGYAGQMQQRPAPATGNKFQRAWWKFFKLPGAPDRLTTRPIGCNQDPAVVIPEDLDEQVQSWDMTFKGGDEHDFVAGGVIARVGANKYILDVVHEHLSFTETVKAVKEFTLKHPQAYQKLVEDKANGSAVIDILGGQISGILAVNPEGGKEVRAAAIEPQVEAGNVFLPEGAPWVDEFIEEFANFPNGKHDDYVDMLSQVLIRMTESADAAYARAMTTW